MERVSPTDTFAGGGAWADDVAAAARAQQARIAGACRHPRGDFEPVVLASPEHLPAYFEQRAAAFGPRLALGKGEQRLTHRELQALASGLAQRILACSGPDPAPVALLLDNGPLAVAAMLAVWKAGKFFVMLDPDAPPERLAAILQDCEAELLVTRREYQGRARAAVGVMRRPSWTRARSTPRPRPSRASCLAPALSRAWCTRRGQRAGPRASCWVTRASGGASRRWPIGPARAGTTARRSCARSPSWAISASR